MKGWEWKGKTGTGSGIYVDSSFAAAFFPLMWESLDRVVEQKQIEAKFTKDRFKDTYEWIAFLSSNYLPTHDHSPNTPIRIYGLG